MINKVNKNLINKMLFIEEGLLKLNLPDKTAVNIGKINSPFIAELNIHTWKVFNRVIKGGSIGFAEAYINSETSSPDISKVIQLLSINRDYNKNIIYGKTFYKYLNYIQHLFKPNSKTGSKKNISHHYDLGNDFYSKWLDSSMTYSSGIFNNKKFDLHLAQKKKYESLCKITNIKPGDNILEIGCGWGGFSEYTAKKYGAKVTAVTISNKQADYAKKRIFEEGLNDLVQIKVIDYRDIISKYDKIISIEMFEAVGEKYWPVFFKKLHDNLEDNGLIGMQLISIKDELYSSYKYRSDFIQKYIFPGGFLPSINVLTQVISNNGLNIEVKKSFAKDYAKTLSIWREKFIFNWEIISKEKHFNENFKRMWEYYLSYCEAGFLSGSTDVHQILLNKQ